MVSSLFGGDDNGGGNPALLAQNATPMPGLPVAGKDSPVIDPHEYGTFQNFLPEPRAEGPNDMATGLRPDMLQYKSPSGVTNPEITAMRSELAKIKADAAAKSAPAADNPEYAAMRASMSPQDLATFQSKVSPEAFKLFMGG